MNPTAKKLNDLIGAGQAAQYPGEIEAWSKRILSFLGDVFGPDVADEFKVAYNKNSEWLSTRDSLIGKLEAMAVKEELNSTLLAEGHTKSVPVAPQANRVFVVHGRDDEAKLTVARFLEQLGLEAVILHEQANSGQTVIEKLETNSNVAFAGVLLTPDDVGSLKDSNKLQPRARQNVIFELGYFIAKLSRPRVCALYKEGVEIPSDYPVVYIPFDIHGARRQKLAQELVGAKFPIKLEALLKS